MIPDRFIYHWQRIQARISGFWTVKKVAAARKYTAFKQRLPIVTRKWHDKEISTRLQWQRQQLENSNQEEKRILEEIIQRASTFTVYRQQNPPFEIRAEMTIAPELLRGFMYDYNATIEEQRHIARLVSHRFAGLIERELATMNLATIGYYREMYQRMNPYFGNSRYDESFNYPNR
jgi:hypothetical protein